MLAANNTRIEDMVVDALHERGFKGRLDSKAWRARPAFLQSFEVGALRYLAQRTSIPLMLLLGGWPGYLTPDNGKSHEEMTTDESLAEISLYASAIGPWKNTLYAAEGNGTLVSTGLCRRAQKQGLQVGGLAWAGLGWARLAWRGLAGRILWCFGCWLATAAGSPASRAKPDPAPPLRPPGAPLHAAGRGAVCARALPGRGICRDGAHVCCGAGGWCLF
jgi:hypothetical protein